MTFRVIDRRTGREPIFDGNHIFKEKWFKASHLIYCDIDGWYIGEDGDLILVDDCGNAAYPPEDRFDIIFDDDSMVSIGHWIRSTVDPDFITCSVCKFKDLRYRMAYKKDYKKVIFYCPTCGARLGRRKINGRNERSDQHL